MSKKYSLALLMIVCMIFLTAAAAPGGDSAFEQDVAALGCVENCLVSANINIKPYDVGETTFLSGTVLIVDENREAVGGAAVTVRWTFPDGTTVREVLKTDDAGFVVSKVPAMMNGMYALDVLRASKAGYRFDSQQGDGRAEFWR